MTSRMSFFMAPPYRAGPPAVPGRPRTGEVYGGGGRESNPPDGERPSHPL